MRLFHGLHVVVSVMVMTSVGPVGDKNGADVVSYLTCSYGMYDILGDCLDPNA